MEKISGKFFQRKRSGVPSIFGILAAIIGVILTINAFRDLSVPLSPQEHTVQFMIPAVILFVSYLLLFCLGRQDTPSVITFENHSGRLNLTVNGNQDEHFKIASVARHSFCIRQVVPSPWVILWSRPWHGLFDHHKYLELTVTTLDGLDMVFWEDFSDNGKLDLPVEATNEQYLANYYSETEGTLVKVEEMLRDKSETEESATDKYY